MPQVLLDPDLPLPERMAAALDGELYAVGDGHATIDEVPAPAIRLHAVIGLRNPRFIAELGTAAWVWGALPVEPARLEFCVDLRQRARPPSASLVVVREVAIGAGDVISLGSRRVTSPVRTAVDLARARPLFDDAERDAVRALAHVGRFGLTDCIALMDRTRNLPARRRALDRLAAVL